MRVRADDSRHFAIEKAPQRDFLAGRLAVCIDNNIRSFFANFTHCCLHRAKRVLQNRLHKSSCLDVDYADFALGRVQHDRPIPRGANGIIQRTQQTRLQIEEWHDIFLVPNVIPRGDH